MSRINIRAISRADGSLWPCLMRDGVPLVLPNLWIQQRNVRANTAKAYLRDVGVIYEMAAVQGFRIEEKARSAKGFTPKDLRQMAEVLCSRSSEGLLSKATCARRREAACSFLAFALQYYIDLTELSLAEQVQAERNLRAQVGKLSTRIRALCNLASPEKQSTVLAADELRVLDEVFDPHSHRNPFKTERIRVRNYCIYLLMRETAPRRGEVVLLELDDVKLTGTPTVIYKLPDPLVQSVRRDGASLKTRGRELPISSRLASVLSIYRSDFRQDPVRHRTISSSLFLSERDGKRMSADCINRMFATVRKVPAVAAMNRRVHPHGLRASSLNQLRRTLRSKRGQSCFELEEALAYIAGWKPGSSMLTHYTRDTLIEGLIDIARRSSIDSEKNVTR